MMLHAIDSRGWETSTAWCVPTAISFITGAPLIHTHSRAAFLQNKKIKDVDGVLTSESLLLLREQGYKAKQIKLADRYDDAPKLNQFLKDRSPYEFAMPLMLQIEDKKTFCHMICCHYGFAADNHTMKIVPISDFPHNSKYVTGAWVVTKQ